MEQSDTISKKDIEHLEERLAQQDHSIHELSNELYQQQQQIALLETAVRYLRENLQLSAPAEAGTPTDETPPHY